MELKLKKLYSTLKAFSFQNCGLLPSLFPIHIMDIMSHYISKLCSFPSYE